jgi:hypothetical protein
MDDASELPPLRDEDYAPDFRSWVRGKPAPARELLPRVFQAPLLSPDSCARILSEVDRRRRGARRDLPSPNSMHDHAVDLRALGFGTLLDALHARLAPLAEQLLPEFAAGGLDSHHSYLVDYSSGGDEDLGFHVDDAEATINICLGGDFRGAELVMMGLRCDLHRQTPVRAEEEVEIEHAPGVAVLHAGRHRHRVERIRSGRRRNLIVWSRSSALRAGPRALECAPWCAWN